jgi:hypothetical protein
LSWNRSSAGRHGRRMAWPWPGPSPTRRRSRTRRCRYIGVHPFHVCAHFRRPPPGAGHVGGHVVGDVGFAVGDCGVRQVAAVGVQLQQVPVGLVGRGRDRRQVVEPAPDRGIPRRGLGPLVGPGGCSGRDQRPRCRPAGT